MSSQTISDFFTYVSRKRIVIIKEERSGVSLEALVEKGMRLVKRKVISSKGRVKESRAEKKKAMLEKLSKKTEKLRKEKKKEKIEIPKGEPSEKWKNKELLEYAKQKGIKIRSGSKKSEILEQIKRHKSVIEGIKNIGKIDLNLKKNLNDEQYAVVNDLTGNMLVLAGAGAGKTRTITYAVASLIKNGAKPEEIVLVTFTRKASQEMIDRVNELLGFFPPINAGTFHSIANRNFLKAKYKGVEFASLLGLKRYYNIISGNEFIGSMRYRAVKEKKNEIMFEKGGYDPNKRIPKNKFKELIKKFGNSAYWEAQESVPSVATIQQIFSAMNNWKKSAREVIEEFPEFLEYREYADLVSKIYDDYTKYKKYENCVDYGDLLVGWNQLLSFDEVKDYAKKFKYFLIDEYQDTNIIQNEIIHSISKLGNTNLILAVGDDAQSIYAFRGANFQNILDFEDNFNAKKYMITYNYRSSPEILDFANAVIKHNQNQTHKDMKPTKPSFKKPFVVVSHNKDDQPIALINIIKELHAKDGVPYEEMGILLSGFKNKGVKEYIDDIQDQLVANSIPYDLRGGFSFFERAHIKDVIAIYEFIYHPTGSISESHLARICKNYIAGLGDKGGRALHSKVINYNDDPKSLIRDKRMLRKAVENARGINWFDKYGVLVEFINEVIKIKERSKSFGEEIEELFKFKVFKEGFDYQYKSDIKDYEKRMKDIKLLMEKGKDFVSFRQFNDEMKLGNWNVGEAEEKTKLVLSTIHKAKGLEWDVVFMPFLYNNFMPHFSAIKDDASPDALEEERRKFYVAVTRARKYLYLFGTDTDGGISQFITELDMNLYEEVDIKKWVI